MGSVSINLAEKRLLKHLSSGGQPHDEVGAALVARFATKVWGDSSVAPALREHGVTLDELAGLYGVVLADLMPEPWMNVGGPLLVPTQWFMEPYRIESLLIETTRDAAGSSRQEWFDILLERGKELARETRSIHDITYGKPAIVISNTGGLQSAGGCASMIVLSVGLALVGAALI